MSPDESFSSGVRISRPTARAACSLRPTRPACQSARVAIVNATVETVSPALVETRSLMDPFHAMVRTRKPETLAPWIAAAKASYSTVIAAGIETDRAAVRAAIIEP